MVSLSTKLAFGAAKSMVSSKVTGAFKDEDEESSWFSAKPSQREREPEPEPEPPKKPTVDKKKIDRAKRADAIRDKYGLQRKSNPEQEGLLSNDYDDYRAPKKSGCCTVI
ncbi:hypothetical protein PROFUN_06942 [Planoprotostelium fungivorum]|uniref:Uncharacterized protein n=1 Tax=Planoprotostelium fungivorum TaxID=1890364 RepID=A0A2P6NN75_9EUKA|nr:hypothetical protein PROFUN_06942 [Planoprotostelium fungivorum]